MVVWVQQVLGRPRTSAFSISGDLRIDSQTVDLRVVVRDVVDEHRAAERVAAHMIAVSISGDLDAVTTDAARVRQILGNLLSMPSNTRRQAGKSR